jgi:hypothetical protein
MVEQVRAAEEEWDEGEKETTIAIRHLKELQKHPGWAILMDIIEKQIHERTDKIVLAPTQDEKVENFMKGEITAYRTFKNLTPILIQSEEYARATESDEDAG